MKVASMTEAAISQGLADGRPVGGGGAVVRHFTFRADVS